MYMKEYVTYIKFKHNNKVAVSEFNTKFKK